MMGRFELSHAQQGLWLHERLLPLKAVYNIAKVVRLKGELDVEALGQALQGLLERHEALRTRFVFQETGVLQEVWPELALRLELEDLCGLAPNEREAEFQRRASEEAQIPFDLERGPLLRARLLRLAPREHGLLLTLHHLGADEWSFGVVCRDLEALYAACRTGRAGERDALAAPACQYPAYVRWQRDWLDGGRLEAQLAYWRQALEGLPALELPADRLRPPMRGHQGQRQRFVLDRGLSAALRALARQEQSTLFTVFLAGLQVLLHRYSGQDDFAVGVPVAGRRREEFGSTVGMFVNTLVMRARLDGDPGFRELLRRTRAATREAYAHQDLPFERLVQALRPIRGVSRSPLFQVMLNGWPEGGQHLDLEGLAPATVEASGTGTAMFDLGFTVVERDGQSHFTIEYASELFDAATVQRMAGHLEELLRAAVADPDRAVAELPLLTESEREQLRQWNETAAPYPRDRCIHELFEQQVRRSPEAVALAWEGGELSYAELNARANRLAHRLRGLGVGPDELVGVCLERSPGLVVALLGVLKAGGAYVPLDPGYPRERLAYMLEDSGARLLLTQQSLLGQLGGAAAEVFCLDRDGAQLDGLSQDDPAPLAGPQHLCYVIYTSGSTGRPKGVMVEHRALVNHMAWMRTEFGFGNDDAVLQKTPVSSDAAMWEFYAALLYGGRLVLAAPGVHRDPAAIVAALHRHRITTLQLVPSLFALLADEPGLAVCAVLRRVFCGGEALPPEAVERFQARAAAQVINLYGPTETCIDSAWWACPCGVSLSSVPIGRSIANTQLYVLDARRQPVPVGVAGELYIGGDGVARGYWKRAELTAERFVPDPFQAGGRLYRTGDRVRYLASGELEYLGRLDDQVKLRGFRIELGEVETALSRQPGVSQAVALVREDRPGDRRLVAYVVGGRSLEPARLRAALKVSLPEYMVPAAIEVLQALPLTPNGKVDRKALPAPRGQEAGAGQVAARDPLEEAVAGVWGELLGHRVVGVHEDFFELGGHSLLAVRVTSRLRELFGVVLPVRAVFEAPTVAGLAQRVRQGLQGGVGSEDGERDSASLQALSRPEMLPLSFAQQRLWFLAQWEPGGAQYNIPAAWWLWGELDVGRLRQALDGVLQRHEVLRTALESQGGEPCQRVQRAQPLALELVDLRGLGREAAEASALERAHALAQRGFDLGCAPLLRAALYRVEAHRHLLALVVHHVAADGWSLGVLARELALGYEGRWQELGELPLQYADYALWQREQLQGELLQAQLGYWRQRLAGLEPLELPTDRPRTAQPSYRGAVQALRLDEALTNGLRQLGRREGATLYMVLLAAFQLLLQRYSGQDDIAVGSPVAGRGRRELEGLVGFFVNTLVLRTDFSGEPTFRQLLARVREHALGAYAHQELPFERLVEELRPQREAGRSPLVQVMFALQNTPGEPLGLAGLQVQSQALETASAKFELTLSLVEQPGQGGLEGVIEYASELFDAATVQRMAGHLEELLRAAVADPNRAVAELPLLTESEREQLRQWNETAAPYPREQCIHELFEQQVRRSPEAVALAWEGGELSYAELNARANRLAHRLRGLGVGPGELVGVCAGRSPGLVVGMLAILKAGGAYVPLDPGYPRERLAFMHEDAALRVVLTEAAAPQGLPTAALTAVALEPGLGGWSDGSAANPAAVAGAASPAYLIYTSGSTGQPKGVAVDHRAVVRLVCGTDYVRLGAGDSVALLSNPAFDAATFEVWGALLNGARLVVTPREVALDPQRLSDFLGRERISTLFLTTALFNEIVRARPEAFAGVGQLLFGGEACDVRRVRECLAAAPPRRLLHVYGPTETTTFATWHEVLEVPPQAASVPIGRPIANATAHVLDAYLQPVPLGVVGELYIGGEGVALGYWRREELTAQRFVPDPFDARPGARLYRTGDRVRRLADGSIEFQGRADQQVKLRGFRIEPGEIEARLAEHPLIGQALVLVREDDAGERRLVAYVLPRSGGEAGVPAELKAWLGQRLPEYMVPSAFVPLAQLPLTPNGKVDRKALPAPRGQEVGAGQLAARDPLEQAVAGVWGELLGRPVAGVHEDFFELGGHSLLAVRVLGRLRGLFGVELPVRALFEAPTVAGLAHRLRAAQACTEPLDFSSLVPIRSQGSGTPLFCVHPVGGSVLCYADLVRHLAPDQPVYGLQHPGMDGQAFTHAQIEDLAARYLQEMYGLQPQGPYLLGGWSMGGVIAFEMARRILADGKEVQLLALFDSELSRDGFKRRPSGVREDVVQFLCHLVRAPKAEVESAVMGSVASNAEEILGDVLLQARDTGWLGADVSIEDLTRWYRVYRGNLNALASYVPGVDYSGPIILFRRSENLSGATGLGGWDALADAELSVFQVPGDHFSMLREPHVGTVARYLNQYLFRQMNGYENDS